MLETRLAARRESALPAASGATSATVIVRPLAAASRFSLRIRAGLALPTLDNRPLDFPINRCARHDERWIARLGPEEWLVGGLEADTEAMAAAIGTALAGRFHALVDISHRSVAIEVTGYEAAAALNAGCPLDLHPSAFPAGSATRTLMGKAEIFLMRPGEAPTFRVECWRSFAVYVHGFLIEAARNV